MRVLAICRTFSLAGGAASSCVLAMSYHNMLPHPGRRTFVDGHDARWTALQTKATGNRQINFYNETLARTRDGNLELSFSNEPKTFPTDPGQTSTAPIQSAMLQTWNKFCFSGGIVEMRAKLPGSWNKAGLWPGFWMMGNLCTPRSNHMPRPTCATSAQRVLSA